MVKKWSDLKLADEKEIKRKKREQARKEKLNTEKSKQYKANMKVFLTFGSILACILVFVLWIIMDWGKVSADEMEKMKSILVLTTSENSKVYYEDGTSVENPPVNVEKKIEMVETFDGEIKFLLKDNTAFHLRKNSKVKVKVTGVTSKKKLEVQVEVLSGVVFIKAADRSEFRIKTPCTEAINSNYCNFNIRLNIRKDNDEYLCEYGNFDIKYYNGGKDIVLKPSQKITFTPDGAHTIGSYSNFLYYE